MEKIIEMAPDLKNNVKFIMGDYERAINNVLHKCFPEAILKGCWFHYNQVNSKLIIFNYVYLCENFIY